MFPQVIRRVVQRVPRSVLTARRTEVRDLALEVAAGAVPADLAGHFFVVAPVGTVATGGLPYPDATTIMNGDGMIVRLDLGGGVIRATSRLARPSCLYADQASNDDPRYHGIRFHSTGITRLSFELGTRDFTNTAFLPFRDRMLITYDAGRPWELDLESLKLVTPMGAFEEWTAETLGDWPFPMILSPAHPAYDAEAGETFTACYGRSMQSIFCGAPALRALARVPRPVQRVLGAAAGAVGAGKRLGPVAKLVNRGADHVRTHQTKFSVEVSHLSGDIPRNFTELVRWDGDGKLEKWPLYTREGKRVAIRQSIHQVAVTRNFVVLLDTGFKIGLDQAFNDPIEDDVALERILRALVTRPQLPNTVLWVVPRAALVPGGGRVIATRVQMPLEADHFLADFDDDGRHVTLHLAHCPATDLSEWVRQYDQSFYTGQPSPADLNGMLAVGAMDLNRLGKYVVDARDGVVLDSNVISDDRTTWAIALYAGRGLGVASAPPPKLRQIYWCTEGFFPELLTHFIYDLYRDYPHRITPLEEIASMSEIGRPSCVIRVDTATMRIADAYELAGGAMASSLQFVPRPPDAQPPGDDPDTDGWIVGVVFTQERNEIWIWNAADLASGPVCRLFHPDLVFGFSIHTAWVPAIARRTAGYDVPVRADLGPRVPSWLQDFFEEQVYRPFEQGRG